MRRRPAPSPRAWRCWRSLTLITGWHGLIAVLALGFLARVLTGPKLSVLGQLATRVIAPRLGPPRLVPGPPKRFAQAIGLTLTTVAAVSSLVFGAELLATVLVDDPAGVRPAGIRRRFLRRLLALRPVDGHRAHSAGGLRSLRQHLEPASVLQHSP